MNASDGRLIGEVVGEIEKEDGVLVIRRIRVSYRLRLPAGLDEAMRQKIERLHEIHTHHCPVYRSIHTAIDITTELHLEEEG